MPDVVIVCVLLSACAAIGAPLCFLLPSDRFAARFAIAPPLGLALFGIGGTVLYRWGITPWLSMAAMASTGVAVASACCFRARPFPIGVSPGRAAAFVATIAAVILICLLPAWTGGSQFRIFQGNVYDQMTYWAGGVTARTHDYAAITAEETVSAPDPVVARGAWFVEHRGAISIADAAVADVSRQGVVDSSYAFMVALQVNLLFAALFVLLNVFSVGYRLAVFLAAALTVGFFQQYIFDINAWSELAAQPLYLLFMAFVVLSFEPHRFGLPGISSTARVGAILGSLAGAELYFYPEGFAVYGSAAVAGAAMGVVVRDSRGSWAAGVAALGFGASLALLLSLLFWSGTVLFWFGQYSNRLNFVPDWWSYFQRYLFGSETNYLAVLAEPTSNYQQIAAAWFSLPVESVAAGLGLYFLLPTAAWPAALAVAWKVALYCFLAVLLGGAIRAIARMWRASHGETVMRMIAACVVGCLFPAVLAWTGQYWAAGKGLSMAAPMLFLLVCTPLLAKPDAATIGKVGRLASLAFVLAHLALGIMRPILVTQLAGSNLPGLPTASAHVREQKDAMDWNVRRWATELRNCHGVFLAIDNPSMLVLARRVAVDVGVKWAASIKPVWSNEPSALPYLPDGWQDFDCVASTSPFAAKPGQTLIWVAADRSIFAYLKAPSADLEIGAKTVAGALTTGAYGIETTGRGPLQWTSQVARFEVPNNPAAPAKNLRLELWPMPLAAAALQITVNGAFIYDSAVPTGAVTMDLEKFAAQDKLAIELRASAVTHFPNDPRDLGVAIRELRLIK
jgi:hypothetical protein